MSTRDSSGVKGGRCVRLTTYHPRSAERQEIRGLNLPGPPWAISTACCGRDLYLYLYDPIFPSFYLLIQVIFQYETDLIHLRCRVCEVSRRKRANVVVNVKFTTVTNKLREVAGNKRCSVRKSFAIRIKKRL